ncbi:MAG: DUF1206 domain-containing protein [Candidatus Phosphoribacter sp.]|nr:DUF1206 domain-containing protein [Actinomycetales bacterium]
MDGSGVRDVIRGAGDHPVVVMGARLGYAVNGLVHLLIAWIGIQLAMGTPTTTADQSGALQTLAGTAFGAIWLWAGALGFAFLALWQVTEAIVRRGTGERLKAAGRTVVYVALSLTCVGTVRGSGSQSTQQTQEASSSLLNRPFGTPLVVLVGIAIIGVGGYHVHKGWVQRFLRDLTEQPGRWAVIAGRYGYIAKGVALAIVGGLFILAGVRQSASESTGLDGAMHKLLELPGGRVSLIVIAVGFAAYAAYSFARAKFARI